MAEVLAVARIHLRIVSARARSQAQYRLSFAIQLVVGFLATLLDFLAIAVIFTNLPLLVGWSLGQVALLYGLANLELAIGDLLLGSIDELPRLVREGSFDVLLIRPLGSLLSVCSTEFVLRRVGRVVQAVAVLAAALVLLDVHWTLLRVLMLPVSVCSGVAIFAAIWVTGAAVTFWTVDTMEMTNAFTYGGGYLASYPITLLGDWMRRLFALAIPLAFVSYYPALVLLGRDDPLHSPGAVRFAGPAVAIAADVVAAVAWRAGVRRHRSTGS